MYTPRISGEMKTLGSLTSLYIISQSVSAAFFLNERDMFPAVFSCETLLSFLDVPASSRSSRTVDVLVLACSISASVGTSGWPKMMTLENS